MDQQNSLFEQQFGWRPTGHQRPDCPSVVDWRFGLARARHNTSTPRGLGDLPHWLAHSTAPPRTEAIAFYYYMLPLFFTLLKRHCLSCLSFPYYVLPLFFFTLLNPFPADVANKQYL
jgi:hypothetical protein